MSWNVAVKTGKFRGIKMKPIKEEKKCTIKPQEEQEVLIDEDALDDVTYLVSQCKLSSDVIDALHRSTMIHVPKGRYTDRKMFPGPPLPPGCPYYPYNPKKERQERQEFCDANKFDLTVLYNQHSNKQHFPIFRWAEIIYRFCHVLWSHDGEESDVVGFTIQNTPYYIENVTFSIAIERNQIYFSDAEAPGDDTLGYKGSDWTSISVHGWQHLGLKWKQNKDYRFHDEVDLIALSDEAKTLASPIGQTIVNMVAFILKLHKTYSVSRVLQTLLEAVRAGLYIVLTE